MKVLNLLHLPWLAGTETAFASICNEISKGGNQVYAVIPKMAEAKKMLDTSTGNLTIIENNKAYKNFGNLDLIFISWLRRFIKNNKIDVAISNNGRNTLILKKAAKGLCPVVAINHGTNPKKTAKADYLLAITSTMAKSHAAAGMNTTNIYKFSNMTNNSEDNISRSKNEYPVIGSIGRFADQKGFDILLLALKILKDKGHIFKAIIGGDGEDRKKLEKMSEELGLENIVEFSGWVNDKKAYYTRMDIFVLSSCQESFGLVLLEAMKYRIPIVATDCDGPIDIIEDGKNGIIVERFKPESIAAGIEKLLNNEKLRSDIAEAGYKNLIENYTEEVVGKKLNESLIKIRADFENNKHNI